MDSNGNKVQTLRQQFENYEKLDIISIKHPTSILKTKDKTTTGIGRLRDSQNTISLKDGDFRLSTNSLGNGEDPRRSGIYVSNNSIPFHNGFQQQSKSQTDLSLSSHKRRPMLLDIHQYHSCTNDTFVEDDNSSLILGKGADGLSTTSSSSSTCVNMLNMGNGNDVDTETKEAEESQAHTPTSSSSASSGSGYGKVKRSNAFRAKDLSPTASSANDSRLTNKPKLVLERVQSLDNSNSGSIGTPGRWNLNENSNDGNENDKTGSPAQRAASVCVRPTHQSQSSKIYDVKSTARQSSATNAGKAVNIVTPYQVSDIYSQIRKGSHSTIKQPQEVEYAIPIITSERHNNNAQLVAPPKVPPPPPPNYPPSKEQIGLPGPDSTYSFLQRRHSPYEDISNKNSPKGQGQDINKHPSALVLTNPDNASSALVNTTPKGLPPDKPPRTFLYDILSDRQTQTQRNNNNHSNNNNNATNNELYGDTSKKFPSSQATSSMALKNPNANEPNPKRQYSSSSSSSTLTSSTTSYKQPHTSRGNISVSTATVRQTNKTGSNINKIASPLITTNAVANANNFNHNGANNNAKSSRMSNEMTVYSANHHPPLVRSKTESQLIVKNKISQNWNRPSAVELGFNSHSHGTGNSNYDYGYKMPTKTTTDAPANSFYAPSSHNHQSQIPLNNQRLYESTPLQYRSSTNTNLLKYNNRYPSTPGIYQASSAWNDHEQSVGLPLVSNIRYSHIHPNHSHPHSHNRSSIHDHKSSSLLYMTDAELEMDVTKELNSLKLRDKSDKNVLSVLKNASNAGVVSINRCSSDDRLCERSKSEWALNHVHNNNSNANLGHGLMVVGGNNRRNTVCNTSGGNSTGHPSLESTASSNVSSTPQHNNIHKRPGIQQSIQNLVNQLFSASSAVGKDATSSTDSGIQVGSESLSSCDTPIGDSTTDTGDSDCENEGETSNTARQVVEARKGYVRRVSSIRVQELGASINRLIQNSKKVQSTEPLFECLLVVGLNRDPYTGVYHAYIRDKFPPNTKLPSGVEQFCFPDSLEWPCHEGLSAQFYTLAITDQRGSRKFGCCFRILPEGANICIPITYCLISSHRAIGFYKEILREITLRHGYSEYQRRFWMEELYKKQFPSTGGNVTVTEPPIEDLYQSAHHHQAGGLDQSVMGNCHNNFNNPPPKTVTIKRRADHRLDETDLVTLLTTVDITTVIKIFGSLLLERKVVLISRALSTLSLCMEALESMLHPFSWQHTFVPILPLSMTDVLDAPAPFLIGVLKSSQTPWDKTLDEGIVVDLDLNKIISCVGDEGTILPKRINKKLRDALHSLESNLGDQNESTKNVLISECFIRMFVETMGHHANHIVVQQDGLKIFERESFVKSINVKEVQNFLEWFSETSMFHEFTQIRLRNTQKHGLFEQRILSQYEQNQSHQNAGSGTPLSFKNAKHFMNRTKPLGNWLKEAFVK